MSEHNNFLYGASPVKAPRLQHRRRVKWVVAAVLAAALFLWAAVAWYNAFIPGQRLASLVSPGAAEWAVFVGSVGG